MIGVQPVPPFGDAIYRWTGAKTGNPWQLLDNGAGTQISLSATFGGPGVGFINAWAVNDLGNIYVNTILLTL